ncbi:MAG: metal-dependent hydrolase, partial [Lewinella sp.]|nr:metal-dependent hydrolase [Lewinella sp.]
HRLYGGREGPGPDSFWRTWGLMIPFFWLLIYVGTSLMPLEIYGTAAIASIVTGMILVFPLALGGRQLWRKRPSRNDNPGWLAWSHLFFWAIITHPLLDTCTTYGTQLFEPFSSYRATWSNISVADPLYTVPFLLCLIIAAFLRRGRPARSWFNYAGITVSSLYMIWTFSNKLKVDRIFNDSLTTQGIVAERFLTTPSIFNNILWTGTAETDTVFYVGDYSLLDRDPHFVLHPLSKHHELLRDHWDDRDVRILRWFSSGYFVCQPQPDGQIRFTDLRFGGLLRPGQMEPDYVFYFLLKEENGEMIARQSGGPPDGEPSEWFAALWERMKGR